MEKIINHIKNLKNIEYIILTLVLILAFLVRFYKIDNPIADWHSFRQADTASVTRVYLEEGVNLLYPRYHDISTTQSGLFNPQGYRFVEFPVFNLVQAMFFRVLPRISLEVWGRLVSIFSSLISILTIFLLGKRFMSKWIGLWASAFYAFLPYNIYFTRVILPEPLAVMLGLLGLWNFTKFIDEEKNLNLVFSSVFFSLALLVKPYLFFYAVPVLYLAIKKYGLKGALTNKKLIFSGMVILFPFVLWRVWIQQFPEGIPFWKWTFNGDDIRFKPSFWKWIFGERLTKLILGYWGLVPFVFGLMNFKRGKQFIYFFLLGMFLYVSIIATANVRHDYYQTIVVPAVALALGSGVCYMWNWPYSRRIVVRGILIFSLFIALITSASEVKEFYKINHPEIIEAGQAVQEIVPKDSLVNAPYNGDTAFLYQTNRRGWPVVDRPINELIEKGAEYFVSVDLGHYQTVEFSEKFEVIKKTDNYVIIKLN